MLAKRHRPTQQQYQRSLLRVGAGLVWNGKCELYLIRAKILDFGVGDENERPQQKDNTPAAANINICA